MRKAVDTVFLKRAVRAYISQELPDEDFDQLVGGSQVKHFDGGEALFAEGDAADGLYLLRRGSATISRKIGGHDIVLSYVAAGNYVGEMALLTDTPRMATVRAAVATEAIVLDGARFKSVIARHPDLRERVEAQLLSRIRANVAMEAQVQAGTVTSYLMQQGIGEATDVLLIDESLCIRCNNCEKACADVHEGTSRLNREAGPTYAQIHVPTSCRHCEHPHCMKDCPPDAINRAPNGEVYIRDTCIGCGNCERNCPYGVIQMAPLDPNRRRPPLWQWLLWGVGEEPGVETKVYDKSMVKKAVKCDMCKDLAAWPGMRQRLPDRRRAARIAGAIPRLHQLGRSVEDPMSDEDIRESSLEYHRAYPPGKISILPTKDLTNQRDLALAYTPGVAAACDEIVRDPAEARNLTARGNLVGVVTNGTAVLGLGAIGPLASKPVMEGKAVLFKKFAGLDCFDIEIDERDPDKLVDIICALEPTFGGINLEDIKAPECFYVERKCRERMNIPVFHDDQHGTAIIVGAAVLNGLRVVGKDLGQGQARLFGAGAAALACLDLLVSLGIQQHSIWVSDIAGVVYTGRKEEMDDNKVALRAADPGANSSGEIIGGADIFLGPFGGARAQAGNDRADGCQAADPRARQSRAGDHARSRQAGAPRRGHRHRPLRLSEPGQQRALLSRSFFAAHSMLARPRSTKQ